MHKISTQVVCVNGKTSGWPLYYRFDKSESYSRNEGSQRADWNIYPTINWPPPVSTSSWAKREKKVKGHLIPYPVRPVAPDRLIEVKRIKNNSLELRKRKTANVNFVSRDQVFPSLVVYCSLLPQKGYLFHATLIHKNCFELFCLRIFYFEKFSTWVWRLP